MGFITKHGWRNSFGIFSLGQIPFGGALLRHPLDWLFGRLMLKELWKDISLFLLSLFFMLWRRERKRNFGKTEGWETDLAAQRFLIVII